MDDYHPSSEGPSLFRLSPQQEGRISGSSSFAALFLRRDSECSVIGPSFSDYYGSIREEGNHHHHHGGRMERPAHAENEEAGRDGNSKRGGGALSPTPLLNVWQGATLLTADCLGTGLLALPGDMKVLGNVIGLGFLIFNLPVNYYAGYIFHQTATAVELQQAQENQMYRQTWQKVLQDHSDYESFRGQQQHTHQLLLLQQEEDYSDENGGGPTTTALDDPHDERRRRRPHYSSTVHHDSASADFIGLSSVLFFRQKHMTRLVMTVFYVNIFLVLGNYLLVMSHALVAFSDDTLCLPTAGGLATVFMIAMTSQMRTMARLGRAASIVSLLALAIVVAQCLWAIHHQHRPTHGSTTILTTIPVTTEQSSSPSSSSLLRKLSALGSIGFAVGSQKLFLNIRHDLADRSNAPKTLGLSLSLFGLAYIGLCLGAGPNPPGFLLDAIPPHSWHRRIAGLLLFVHVIVSYSINSQALCSSLDRLVWRRLPLPAWSAVRRWWVLTTVLALTAYTVSNAIPFFTDLIALIGAISSVPLTLLFPALYWRKLQNVPLWGPFPIASAALTYFALFFAVLATVGSLDSIGRDWSAHGPPFSCK